MTRHPNVMPEELLDQLSLRLESETAARAPGQFKKDCIYLSSQYARLAEQYDNEFVAIYRHRVRAHAPDIESVLQELRHQGIDPGDAAVRWVSQKPQVLIL